MSVDYQDSTIGFVWRPEELTPAVTKMARQSGSAAVFDCSMMGMDLLGPFLQRVSPAGGIRDVKISAAVLMDPSLGQLLKRAEVHGLWVECFPEFSQGDSPLLQRLMDLSKKIRCFPIITDMGLLEKIVKNNSGIDRIVLKGCEAAGFVSKETTLTLYSMAKEILRSSSTPLDILIWGGVFTPEAAAAFLYTGSAGIIFESLHWLTDMVAIDDLQRERLLKLRLDSTDLAGLGLGVPCRFFNKGNSVAFKEIRRVEDSLYEEKTREESRQDFISRVNAKALHPLTSLFSPEELIFLGVEIAFAEMFARRFGSKTEDAVKAFIHEIHKFCGLAGAKKNCFMDSPAAKEMGTVYPFIQGAMSWITDVPEFALNVAHAGGLPTIALGMMDAETLDKRLGHLPKTMGSHPYAVNFIALSENPFKNIHLAWIKKHRPRFVVIAGGDLSPIRELLECGIEVMYIAPDEALLRLALKAGVHYVILEGYEAGGHVGTHSTLTLAQMVLGMKQSSPSLFGNCRVILAGGIFNRETAFMAAMLEADAIQMGTAYLSCREIIETGALTPLYQRMILTSPLGGTIVSGHSTGLRVRALKTPVTEAVLSLERKFAAGRRDETSFRKQMETMAAGSLFTAARGMDRPGSMPLDERACLERGQFMGGACAGLIREVHDLSSFHRELAQGTLLMHQPHVNLMENTLESRTSRSGMSSRQIAPGREDRDRIAITGMSIVNTLGKSPGDVWAASLAMESGIIQVPPSRWDQARFYDPRPNSPDKTYCRVGAFLDFHVDRKELGISPHDFRSMTQATRVTLWLAHRAIRESGILSSSIPPERIAVLVSQNSGEASGMLTNTLIRAYVGDILGNIKRAVNLTPDQERAVEEQIKAGRMAPDDTTLLGRLNCAAVGFICSRYGFMGPSYAVSAACATSLVAVHSAIQMLKTGIIDAAVIGGGEENLSHMHFMEFSALGALYGLSGKQRPPHETSCPFDAQRDGMVLGEGGAMIVIERESLALERGARIHALITGVGASNNHLGIVESASDAQEMAIRASFKETSYGPDAVDLVECHGTSTRQGDAEEVIALKAIFNSSRPTMLSAFKSQIGHTLGASGISSLIRGVTAMKAGIFPPTLNYKHPDPEIKLEQSGFIVNPEPLDWKSRNGDPRRLEVNAFGFGGSNYVVQVEEAMEESGSILVAPQKNPDFQKDPDLQKNLAEERMPPPTADLPGDLLMFRAELDNRNFRVAVVGQSKAQALRLVQNSVCPGGVDIFPKKDQNSLARQGIFMQAEELQVLPLAFVFPGQGTHYAGMGHDLYHSFPVIREWMDRAAAVADFDLLHLMFHDQEENLRKTRWQQPALFVMETAMARYLTSLGIFPVAMAGHSLGELTALCMAGVYSLEDGFRIVNKRALCMDKAAAANLDPGVMAATDAPLELLNRMRKGCDDVHIGNINSPNQIVLSGSTESIRDFCSRLRETGHRTTLLRVSMAFHSPVMEVIHDELAGFIAEIPFYSPRIPVISNTTRMPYPSNPDGIKKILMAHLESTVHWMDNVRTLWNNHGVRLFVEVGPGDVISNLTEDTLAESTTVQTCLSSEESLTFKRSLAQLFVHGHLKDESEAGIVSISAAGKAAVADPIERAPTLQSVTPQYVTSGHSTPDPRELIFQREINRFMMAKFGSSLEPNILKAFRQELDPEFKEEDLSGVITSILKGYDLAESPVKVPPAAPGAPEGGLVPGDDDVMEKLIYIIMDATGFNRDEIEPDMNLRSDLSIRSSRLPIIMDAAERQFNIIVELEDFIDVHTVKDIARTISRIMAGQAGGVLKSSGLAVDQGALHHETLEPEEGEESLKRLVFTHTTVELERSVPIELNPGGSVMILSSENHDTIAEKAGEILRMDYNLSTSLMAFLQDSAGLGKTGHDIRTEKGALQVQDIIAGLSSVSGLVIALSPGGLIGKITMADVSKLVQGFFLVVKAFLRSPNKKFVVLVHSRQELDIPQELLAEGMLGLFLSAALEYPSVQFRTVEIEPDTDLRRALGNALDRGATVVEMMHRKQELFTSEARLAPLDFSALSGMNTGLNLGAGDVVVMSGGATGISAHLARSLAPFAPHLVFLGRTIVDSGFTPAASNPEQPSSKAFIVESRASEIARTLAELHTSGIKATYHTCDVTDPEAVKQILGEVITRYGKIDGIIHSAGVLRDSLLSHMIPDDISMVTDVKFLGAWNLYSAAKDAGLRFFVGLSSAAAIQGNPGQANYAAANRMMSALLRTLGRENSAIRFKAIMLPPVEGTGMASDPEIKAMMKKKGVVYIHMNELTGLFCRELFAAPAEDTWVMFMKRLPKVSGAMLNDRDRPSPGGGLNTSIVSFRPGDFPMIETIVSLDLCREELEALRSFSLDKDLWITDHKPFKFIKHAIVSGTMILETFMETALMLYPHLQVRGVRKVRLMDMIQCPPGIPRPARISCRRSGGLREPVCDVFLAAQEISPAGRLTDRFTPQCSGQVILDGGEGYLGEEFPDFPVRMNELRTGPMDHKKVLKWYKNRSGLGGRYRVIEFLDGAGPRVVRGQTTYPFTNDFANLHNPEYQYPPYLFEALLQLVCCHSAATDPSERRSMIPMEIGEMRFLRKIKVGEKITLEARMRAQDDKGVTWDTRGLDDQGRTLMQIYGLRMQWVSD
ncbi:MAG: SDR family NAD(P)-dependent oxidoreductase [Desulfobacterium sp.]|nr:SDR family NAD(P)-dependent oxidoreductase [Desulfobacterium sp.]